jgi:hypothetical protein
MPFRIFALDKSNNLPGTVPLLKLLLTGNCGVGRFEDLGIDEPVDVVAVREAANDVGLVLIDAAVKVIRDPDIDRPSFRVARIYT